ncbi:MAG: hypothetical protein BAJATHORv1_10067 [Candidatus Thorarchaeota archaeon]|nr:MAG: hypothetical protein BAJATHORv1_10067 [Candidatus Thorarchaeota archaeon]
MKGVYAIIADIDKTWKLNVGKLGFISLSPGTYVYAGSAMGTGSTSLENRIKRHFSPIKTIHWHIDYLIEKATSIQAWYAESDVKRECELSQAMEQSKYFKVTILGFGSSDCRERCKSHLYRYVGGADIFSNLVEFFPNLESKFTTDGNIQEAEE